MTDLLLPPRSYKSLAPYICVHHTVRNTRAVSVATLPLAVYDFWVEGEWSDVLSIEKYVVDARGQAVMVVSKTLPCGNYGQTAEVGEASMRIFPQATREMMEKMELLAIERAVLIGEVDAT